MSRERYISCTQLNVQRQIEISVTLLGDRTCPRKRPSRIGDRPADETVMSSRGGTTRGTWGVNISITNNERRARVAVEAIKTS